MRPLRYIPRYTVDDYRLWEGDWELIDGIPYAMSPPAVLRHQRIGSLLVMQIANSIKGQNEPCQGYDVIYSLDWIVDNNTVVRPDIAIICEDTGDFISSPPALIVEILSPSTAFKDRQVKFDIYQEQGVKYYIIVDPNTKTYSTFQLIDKQYKEQNTLTSFVIHGKCEVQFDIQQALLELGMA